MSDAENRIDSSQAEIDDLRRRVAQLEEENLRISISIMELCNAVVTVAAMGAAADNPEKAKAHLVELRKIIRKIADQVGETGSGVQS